MLAPRWRIGFAHFFRNAAFVRVKVCSLCHSRRSCLWVQGSEEESNEEEDEEEANAHEDESLNDEGVLLLIDQTVINFRGHGFIFIDGQQVEVNKLGLAEHQLDISVLIFEINRAHRAVKQIIAIGWVEDFHVNQTSVLRQLLRQLIGCAC